MKHRVLDLRPTQIALGMKEVEYRLKKILAFSEKERDAYLHERHVPVVLGSHSRIYIIDRHHLVRSCWEAGVVEVPIEVKADLSHLSAPELWKSLDQLRWIYPFDQFGNGPHDPVHLPESIRSMADDPYRSVAWMVREKGGFEKAPQPFSEFHWANFFRKFLKRHPSVDSSDEILKEALALCESDSAKHLPGYIPKK